MREEFKTKLEAMDGALAARDRLVAARLAYEKAWKACEEAGHACAGRLDHGDALKFFGDMRDDFDRWSEDRYDEEDTVDVALTKLVQDGAQAVAASMDAGELAEFRDCAPRVYGYFSATCGDCRLCGAKQE